MTESVEQWLAGLGLPVYAELFRKNDIEWRSLALLDDNDLKELGISLGHRRILTAAIAELRGRPPARKHAENDAGGRSADALHWSAGSDAERRQLTVMFCDLAGSTELSRRLDPEQMRDMLQRYQDAVATSVVRYDGHVARYVGDGVLAYFGWPQAHEDQAERALRAGLDIVAAVGGIQLVFVDNLQVRIGIDSGQVVVGDIVGDVASESNAVIGDTANLAARLQGIAQAGQIVIGANTELLVGEAFELRDLGAHRVKGFADEVHAWAVTAERPFESRFEASRGKNLTTLVGREHELGLLRERWELARRGEGQVVLLPGEAGIGKSRVVQSFTESIGNAERFNLRYQCSAHHMNSAFHPVIQRVKRAAGFTPGDNNEARLDRLEAMLTKLGADEAKNAPLFASLLSLRGEQRYGALDLTPAQLRFRTIEALVGQVLNLSRQRPVLMVLEDVHWIDPSMKDFIAELIPRIANQRVYLLITYRPENVPDWSDYPHATSVALNRLGREQAAQIVRSVGGQKMLKTLTRRIVERADGVPLYIEELTKSVVETFVDGNDTASSALVPVSLHSSLVARLDRLGDAREIAQIASVIGREFSYRMLAGICGAAHQDVDESLDRLVESGLMFRRGALPDMRYTFKHALVQDAAYSTILISRRRQLHARIVEFIEHESEQSADAQADLLGHHAFHAELWDKAAMYLQRSGQLSIDQAAVREAVAQFELALQAGRHLPETSISLERAIDLRFDLRNALWSIGGFEQILEHLNDAEVLANRRMDPSRIGWISVFRSASHWQLGRSARAISSAEDALAISKTVDDESLSVGANFYLGCAHITTGNCHKAEPYFESIARSLTGGRKYERCGLPFVPAVISRSWLVWALAERGEFEQGQRYADEALQIAMEVGHPFNLAHIYYDIGYFYEVKGEFDRAVDALSRGYDLIQEWNLSYLSPFITGFYGHACVLAGRVKYGTELLRRAMVEYESIGLGLFRSLVTMQFSEALLLSGRDREAWDTAEQALILAIRRGERGHEACARRLLGDMALRDSTRDTAAAKEHFRKALQAAVEFDLRPIEAHCHFGLSRVHGIEGNRPTSKAYLQRAENMYLQMDMSYWVERAQMSIGR